MEKMKIIKKEKILCPVCKGKKYTLEPTFSAMLDYLFEYDECINDAYRETCKRCKGSGFVTKIRINLPFNKN